MEDIGFIFTLGSIPTSSGLHGSILTFQASRGKGFSRPGLSWGWILASLGRRGQDYGVLEPQGVVSHVRINPRGPFSSENTGPMDLLFLR